MRWAEVSPSKAAIHFDGVNISYLELWNQVEKTSNSLQVRKGDRVAWLGRPSEAWYEIFFGVAKARACFAPINSRLAIPEIAFIVRSMISSSSCHGRLFSMEGIVTAPHERRVSWYTDSTINEEVSTCSCGL